MDKKKHRKTFLFIFILFLSIDIFYKPYKNITLTNRPSEFSRPHVAIRLTTRFLIIILMIGFADIERFLGQ